MANAIDATPESFGFFPWFRSFLEEELAPYPGRVALVARKVLTATIVLILVMTFRIPYGAFATLFTLTISRENTAATVKAVTTLIVSFAAASTYAVAGAAVFSSDPILRFGWIVATLFLVFYVLSTLSDHSAAIRFGYLLIITLPLWDEHISAHEKVGELLWAAAAMVLAGIVTLAIELIYASIYKFDDVAAEVLERLAWTEAALRGWSSASPDRKSAQKLARLAILGTSRMRRELLRSGYAPEVTQQWGAIVSLVGRLVDLAANLSHFSPPESEDTRRCFGELAERANLLARCIAAGEAPPQWEQRAETVPLDPGVPLLIDLDTSLLNIASVLRGFDFPSTLWLPAKTEEPRTRLLVADAFTSSSHIRFTFRGGLAAIACYLAYSMTNWPDISTAVTTCFLTALTTVGSSRQKQILRFGGALAGGTFGIGAQIFVLPSLDSIAGFAVLFIAATIVAAWISASGPRLSYFGVQFAFAFYLINVEEFRFQTSLAVARDRAFGILLGLVVMWIVFDQLWGAPAIVEMKRTFLSTLKLMARFMSEPEPAGSFDQSAAIEQSYQRREALNAQFDKIRYAGDGVMLEFGRLREHDLALRTRLLDWQLQLRVIFIMRIAVLKYRLRLRGFELPEPVLQAQQVFDSALAKRVEQIADHVEDRLELSQIREPLLHLIARPVEDYRRREADSAMAARSQNLLALCRRIDSHLILLADEIAARRDAEPTLNLNRVVGRQVL